MNDLPNWAVAIIAPVLSGIAAFGSAWIGVRIAVTEHGIQLAGLRKEFDELKVVFDAQTAERSGYIRQINESSERLDAMQTRLELTRTELHSLRNQVTPWSMLLNIVCTKLDIPWERDR